MKSHDIDEFISKLPKLIVKENKGGRFRISHIALKSQSGSLWFSAYSEKYRIYPTGEVITLLGTCIKEQLGAPDGKDMDRDFWFVENLNDVKKIIRTFADLNIKQHPR